MPKKRARSENQFHALSSHVSDILGSVRAFTVAVAIIFISGIFFRFSQEWEQHLGFAITVATFLFLFLLQNCQNEEAKATHLKLDEMIRAQGGARNEVAFAEEKSEEEIDELRERMIKETSENSMQ